LSLVIGFLATIVPEKLASQGLDASTEATGPRAFVVRVSTIRQRRLRVHRTPPLVRDDGQRPSSRDGMAATMPLIATSVKAKYFSAEDLTFISENQKVICPTGHLVAGMQGSWRDQHARILFQQ
ncbi:MAG: hypothetical protein JO141_28360, partial [Bradyrhizobium sp.]|nr:hypothetical protein [Bradyrhizobium sp.]